MISEETTQELLSNYQTYEDDKFGKNEDISLYSISGEDQDHQLSELYELLNDDSIEIKRSTSILNLSPLKTSSPLKMSPSKKLKNDYQDHIFRARTGSVHSPTKKRDSPIPIDFSTTNDSGYDSIERNIEMFLEGQSKRNDNENVFDLDADKTELIIRETHKLINSIPPSILSGREGEKYSSLLTSAITKIIRAYEVLKQEKQRLTTTNEKQEDEYHNVAKENSKLRDQCSRNSHEINRLKNELAHCTRKLHQQVPQQNSQTKRENDLLREKLIKYKTLSDETLKEVEQLKEQLKNEVGKEKVVEVGKEKVVEVAKEKVVDIELQSIYEQLAKLLTKKKSPTPTNGLKQGQDQIKSSQKEQLNKIYEQLARLQEQDNEEPLRKNTELENINEQMINLFSGAKKHSDKKQKYDYQTLPIFEKFMKQTNEKRENAETRSVRDEEESNDSTLRKVLSMMEKNHQMYRSLLEKLDEKASRSVDKVEDLKVENLKVENMEPVNMEAETPKAETTKSENILGPDIHNNPRTRIDPEARNMPKPADIKAAESTKASIYTENVLTPLPNRDRLNEIVLQCYVCCNHRHDTKNVDKNAEAVYTRGVCQQCSETLGTHTDKTDTVELMGEYKWII